MALNASAAAMHLLSRGGGAPSAEMHVALEALDFDSRVTLACIRHVPE